MKKAFSILLIAIVCACGSTDSSQIKAVDDDPLYMFNDFPDSLFLGLYFAQKTEDARLNMEQNNFELIDSSGAWRYWNREDSNEVILPATEHLHSFKLLMRSSDIFKSLELLYLLLQRDSKTAQRNAEFSIYTYDQKAASFKVSVFEQKDLIRLNFEEQIRK